MKFLCQSSKLQRGIGVVEKAVSSRTTLPVLENIFFEVKGKNLILRGNDLEVGIEFVMPVDDVSAEGKVLVKAKTISSIVSKLQNQSLDFQASEDGKVVIRAGRVDYNLLGMKVDEYPEFPSVESGLKVVLKVGELKELIKHTIFAVSFDETKQFLNGILVKSEQERCRIKSRP